ncbi:DEKNAAC105421 [Brettanomyces naardenensis]|uniref:DEKNAAC105421 n=1 Tax=Brettanomyces naardenensis TaxID=13370 RepID=A0A448YT96_BRENA|nr:DEKNAAC105421 [Brettanomyces naardenensis]
MTEEIQFRIIVGSYEHSLLCLSVTIPQQKGIDETPDVHFHPVFHFEAHTMSIRAMDVGKRYLVSGSNDEHIRIYDMQKRKELGTLLKHQGSITKLVFSDEAKKDQDADNEYLSHKTGRWLLSAAEDGNILIWRVKDWEQFGTLKGHKGSVNDLCIHPSGRVAISVSSDRTVKLWNLMMARKASTLKLRGKTTLGQLPYFCKFDKKSGGEYFVIGLTTRLIVYKTREARILHVYTVEQTIMCMEFLVLGEKQYLVLGMNDGSLNFYGFDGEEEEKKKEDEEDGDGEDEDEEERDEVEVDADDSDEEESQQNHHNKTPKATPLGSPDFQLQGHATRVKGFSIYQQKRLSDGKILTYIVSISSDGRIVVWDMDKKEQVAEYSTGERLNVVSTVQESIEKPESMRHEVEVRAEKSAAESESDGEGLVKLMKGKKRSKKQKRRDKKKLIRVELPN